MVDIKTVYDIVIIGAGAGGLFAGASFTTPVKGLILEKGKSPGKKLLMSGSGQCNLTHGGSIKEFISHYGENGNKIRPILYKHNNLAVIDFFKTSGVPLMEREDGKIFPASLKAQDILSALLSSCENNGFLFKYSSPVVGISTEAGMFNVCCENKIYMAKSVIIATGGCSYPSTGSDGNFLPILAKMGFSIISPKPALVPIHVEKYPYADLAGISISPAEITINNGGAKNVEGDLLFTHSAFSGPAVLSASRYVADGAKLSINYFPPLPPSELVNRWIKAARDNRKQLATFLYDTLNTQAPMPRRLVDLLCHRSMVNPWQMASAVTRANFTNFVGLLTRDEFIISGTRGFKSAMVTAGGVSLDEIHLKTMESKKYPGLYFVGEILDIDGDTGGYNLQFAFSSAHTAISKLSSRFRSSE